MTRQVLHVFATLPEAKAFEAGVEYVNDSALEVVDVRVCDFSETPPHYVVELADDDHDDDATFDHRTESPATSEVGELGVPFDVLGSVAQSIGRQAADRGEVTRDQVVAYMTSEAYDEDDLWSMLGPWVDEIENGARKVAAA